MKKLGSAFFIKSRSKLKSSLPSNSLVIISSNRQHVRNGDNFFPFRQSSDMFYLSGIRNPGVTLIVFKGEGDNDFKEILLIPEENNKQIRWEGPGLSVEEAAGISGIKRIISTRDLEVQLKDLLKYVEIIYFGTPGKQLSIEPASNEIEIRNILKRLPSVPTERSLAPVMTHLRMIKEEEEIEMIREAVFVCRDAFLEVLSTLKPGMKEYEVEAIISCVFTRSGIRSHAFDPIIATGKNGLTLHYTKNDSYCREGELLLMDYGAEWEYYASDVSRTIPVNGVFSKRQMELYRATLHILKESTSLMKPGITLTELNDNVGRIWAEEHMKLGLYNKEDMERQLADPPPWKNFFWHGISHSIGLDVHDPFDASFTLEPGMVLSCEPGIYIPDEDTGIRIENDILITENEPENLSAMIPVEPDEIESLMKLNRI